MVKVTLIFDNSYASPMSCEEFIKKVYLTEEGNTDLIYISKVEQESCFKELIDEEKIQKEICSKCETDEDYYCSGKKDCYDFYSKFKDINYMKDIYIKIKKLVHHYMFTITGRGQLYIVSMIENNLVQSDVHVGNHYIIDDIEYIVKGIEIKDRDRGNEWDDEIGLMVDKV